MINSVVSEAYAGTPSSAVFLKKESIPANSFLKKVLTNILYLLYDRGPVPRLIRTNFPQRLILNSRSIILKTAVENKFCKELYLMGIKSVKFRGRHNSWRAILFLITGSLALILFLVLAILTAVRGESAFSFGVMGVIAAVLSLVGVIVSAVAAGERDIFVSVPIAGMIVNGISFILYVVIYILGIS